MRSPAKMRPAVTANRTAAMAPRTRSQSGSSRGALTMTSAAAQSAAPGRKWGNAAARTAGGAGEQHALPDREHQESAGNEVGSRPGALDGQQDGGDDQAYA